ncbi:hypothetical protein NH340_JMT01680 [Sarcoptes scabiei]|nr:hypothetical protein NH340_JMT01680 [Sarcoptes scabiei]
MDDRADTSTIGSFPAPSIGRCIYGFVLFLVSIVSLIFYYLWAFIPSEILIAAGITYFPSKYWAICIPIYSLSFIIIFAIFLYPAINMILTPSLDSVTTIYDRRYRKNDLKSWSKGIPAISDLPLDFVCRHLYLREDCDE